VSRDWLLYLDDLIASAEKIARFVSGQPYEKFVFDEVTFDAVLFNLQIIGEAMKSLPESVRQVIPAATATGAARMRDLIAHHYFGIDAKIIWQVATEHVPLLLTQARAARSRNDAGESA
jgi:uncharacterized protein with HEPN domain